MSTLAALIFDVDGTLADTERDGHRVAFNLAFQEAGLDWEWSPELYGELLAVTGGKERIRFYLDKYNTGFKRPGDLDEFVAGLHAAKTGFYTKLMAKGAIPLRPGVERLINEAKDAGVRLAIATTTTPENVTALLTYTLGADSIDWFEVIGAGDVVPLKKPAPDIFHYVLDKMNLASEQCVAFEDSYNGMRSAHQARLTTIVTTNGYTADDDFDGAAIVLDQMGEPDASFTVQAGDALGFSHLNLGMVRALHKAEHG
ncbi:phosphatase [Candidatus Tenderia electrophaga]|jgi:HAD superfamily hydrolase (TIGR01509 family)|uniref:Phosphatase n=1 Tax=Candidatus Tenderia electrophaga TaxID=1748243 RepID=A0A0S2TEB7_9GAMM|nr:phosphatase [Candidatus Tenderia electrophaga]